MAEKRLWAVRVNDWYRLYRGNRPRFVGIQWDRRRKYRRMIKGDYEFVFEKRFWLKPGGGPVEVRFE